MYVQESVVLKLWVSTHPRVCPAHPRLLGHRFPFVFGVLFLDVCPANISFSSLELTWSCLGISTSCRAGSLFPKSFNVLLSTFGRRICLISSSWPHGGIRPHTWLCSQIVCPSMSQPACSHRCSPQDAGRALGSHSGSWCPVISVSRFSASWLSSLRSPWVPTTSVG